MSSSLRTWKINRIFLSFFLLFVVCFSVSGTTYTSVKSGNWFDSSTWGLVSGNPGTTVSSGDVVIINHNVHFNTNSSLINNGRIEVRGTATHYDTLSFNPDGTNIENYGTFLMRYAALIQPVFKSSGVNGSGNFFNKSDGRVDFCDVYVEISQDWAASDEVNPPGIRTVKNGCIRTGQNYTNNGNIDSLVGVCLTIGLHGSGNFQHNKGHHYFDSTEVKLAGTSGEFQFNDGSVDGQINAIVFDPASGGLFGSSSVSGSVNLTYYCMNGGSYTPNGKFGSPANSCTQAKTYFPCACTPCVPSCLVGSGCPCDATRWTGGDGWINGVATSFNGSGIRGIVSCASDANTQSNIQNNTIYYPCNFTITVGSCLDPNTDPPSPVSISAPVSGQPIRWFNFDVRAFAALFDIQIIGGQDNIGWSLYYSNSPTNSVGANGLSGDCSDLTYLACGTSFTGWSAESFEQPDINQTTNFYVAVWDRDYNPPSNTGNFSFVFKARFGCGSSQSCVLQEDTRTITCNTNGTYTVETDFIGINGTYTPTDNTGNAVSVSPASVVLTNVDPGTSPQITTATVTAIYNNGDAYEVEMVASIGNCSAIISGTAPPQCSTTTCTAIPTISCPGDFVGCPGDNTNPSNTGTATAIGSASPCGIPIVTYSDVTLTGSCPGEMTISRTWIASEPSDPLLSASCVQLIILRDEMNPTLSGVPADAAIECDEAIPGWGTVTASDNCDNAPVITTTENTIAGSCPGIYTIERVWTATDNCGNESTAGQKIEVIDTQGPTLAGVPADAAIECDEAIPGWGNVTASDNCDNAPVITTTENTIAGSCPGIYTIERVWTATDNCGNETTAGQKIEVSDTNGPTLAGVPGDATAECDNLPGWGTVTATDNCDAAPVITTTENTIAGSCPGIYTIERVWTATDNCGNETTAGQKIEVSDTNGPVLAGVPADVAIECDEAIPGWGTVTATDNCDNAPVIMTTENTIAGSCPGIYTIERVWTATDNCGNETTAGQKIEVSDTNGPVLAGVPADVAIECDEAIPGWGTVTATDNCDNAPVITTTENTIAGSCPGIYTIERVWTATDNCGNETTAGQTIEVSDNTAPSLSGVPVDAMAECDNLPGWGTVTATDNCDNAPVITTTENTIAGSCPGIYTIERVWTATDNCGNETTAGQTIEVSDNTAPSLSGVPVDAMAECDNLPGWGTVTATDNCDNAPVITTTENTIAGSCPGIYTIERVWTATDNCGNESTAGQNIEVSDITDPTMTCPEPVSVECIEDVPAAATDLSSFVALDVSSAVADNCDATLVVEHVGDVSDNNTCPEVITRTYKVTDACGNSVDCTQTITVSDITDPTMTCPDPVSVECIEDVPAAATDLSTFVALDASSAVADNCDATLVVEHVGDVSDNNTCPEVITRTYKVTDACGNSVDCTQTITVSDITDPTMTCPEPVSVECIEDVPAAATDLSSFVALDANSAVADNCDATLVVEHVGDVSDNNTCPEVITRTYKVTDACGNSVDCTQTITVSDITDPTLSGVPASTTAECDNLPGWGNATATDNCDLAPVITTSESTTAGSCPSVYTIERIWTATDACGNETTLGQTIEVSDNTNPVLAGVPASTTAECDNLPGWGNATATDNCDLAPVITTTESTTAGSCPSVYTIERIWTATDACGNETTLGQTIEVSDNTNPVLAGVPASTTAECDNLPGWGNAMATDNCDLAPVITTSESTTAGSCPSVYSIERIWTATDACGNETTLGQTIEVSDNTNPVLAGVPADATIDCDNLPSFAVLTATDNCDSSPTITTFESRTSGNCPSYTLTRTWIATDNCGNTSTVTQTILVEDNEGPVITNVPTDATAECSSIPPFGKVTAMDDCSSSPAITTSETTISGSCPGIYTIERVWTATDHCGNETTAGQTIEVSDNTNPVLAGVPASTTAECDNLPGWGNVTVTDNCDLAPVITTSESTKAGLCPGIYTIERVWTATDNCGNESTAGQKIEVSDNTAPVLSGVPASTTAECDNLPGWGIVTASDNCDNAPVITTTETTTAGSCPGIYTIERVWTATDNCGNESTAGQTIEVRDNTAPVLSGVPLNATFECNAVPSFASITVWDNCDASPVISTFETSQASSCPTFTITRVWVVRDACGNESSASQILTVRDSGVPQISGVPASTTASCSNIPQMASVIVIDECDPNPTVVPSESTTQGLCPGNYTITRTWLAEDACGNTTEASQLITVMDVEPPFIANLPEDSTVPCDELTSFSRPLITDNCDSSPSIVSFEIRHSGSCPNEFRLVRRLQVTDNCGNISTAEYTVYVIDNTPPQITCPPSQVVNAELNTCGVMFGNVNIPNATFYDLCSNVQVNSGSSGNSSSLPMYPIGTTVVVYSAADECGNISTCSFNIEVVDAEDPVVLCPVDLTIPSDENTCSAMLTFISPSAGDNCPGTILQQIAGPVSSTSLPVGTTSLVFLATDLSGNTATCDFEVTVSDSEKPNISCPSDRTAFARASNCNSPFISFSVNTNDNCGFVEVTNDFNGLSSINSRFSIGTKEVIFTVTDAEGNESTCLFKVTVKDTVAPLFVNCPGDITLPTTPRSCHAQFFYQIPVSDNCTNSFNVRRISGPISGSIIPLGSRTVEYRVADNSGNESTCKFKVTVKDFDPPELLVCPPSMTVYADSTRFPCGANATWPTPSAYDPCGNVQVTSSHNNGAFFPAGSHTIIVYHFTDPSGNTSSCSFTVTVKECGNILLPVELLEFNGTHERTHNLLSWESENEELLYEYILESSENVQIFGDIGHISALNRVSNSYEFLDKEFFVPFTYYRLKIVENDGSFRYSETIQVKTQENAIQVKVVPNPSNGRFIIQLENTYKENYVISIYDSKGALLNEMSGRSAPELTTIPISLERYANGIFLISVEIGGKQYTIRSSKQ